MSDVEVFWSKVAEKFGDNRTWWMMAGAYTGQQIVESNIGKQTVELIELKLAEELEVLKNKAKEKTK